MAGACSPQEEQQAAPLPVAVSAPARLETRIVIPEAVQGRWTAVKIAVFDKESQKESVITIPLGGEIGVEGTGLRLQVKNFLPAFVMDGRVMTSTSNETRNPAVQVVIRENDVEIFTGWLFTLYPSAHVFQHPRYSFSLVDYIPAGGKKG